VARVIAEYSHWQVSPPVASVIEAVTVRPWAV